MALNAIHQSVDAGYLTFHLRHGVIFEKVRNHPDYPALEEKTDKLVRKHLDRLAELEGNDQAL